jgi:hypothetical protein|tara:strand:- start:323 stop:748 length:426 start_codon:yes stop_codon:yes gene_type:complete
MEFVYDDGGRSGCGFKGNTGDCFTRALAIAAQMDYREAYNLTNAMSKTVKLSSRCRGKSSARLGVHKEVAREIMAGLGWGWVPTMLFGQGCKVHLRADELPQGRILCSVSKHFVAVIDGVSHDNHDPRRNGRRCVYGYWIK